MTSEEEPASDVDAREQEAPQATCRACAEPIRPEASVCWRCGEKQRSNWRATLASFLRWLGGATVVLALVTGTIQLSALFSAWLQNREAVDRFVAAAGVAADLDEFEVAWESVSDALAINPAAEAGLDGQLSMAMTIVRDGPLSEDSLVTKAVRRSLLRGAGSEESERAADAYAHLAWFEYRLRRPCDPETGSVFERHYSLALEKEADNLYAHTFRAFSVLTANCTELFGYSTAKERFNHAQESFEQARANGRDQAFIDEWEFDAFLYGESPLAQHEAMRRVAERLREGRAVPGIEELATGALIHALTNPFPDEREWLAEVDHAELAGLFDEVFGEHPWDQDRFREYPHLLMIARATVHEALGEREQAAALFAQAKRDYLRGPSRYMDYVESRLEEVDSP